jgi:hypothetical protein
MPFDHEPSTPLDRQLIAQTVSRIAAVIKVDERVNVLHALAAIQNVLGSLLATQIETEAERQHLIQTIITNLPLYVGVYQQRERIVRPSLDGDIQ